MINVGIAFYVIGALFSLYVVAATWRSKDVEPGVPAAQRRWKPRSRRMDRRIAHWWRPRQR
jgi:hypothetical protein